MEPRPNEPTAIPGAPLAAHWLGRIGYRDAWDLQKRLAGGPGGGPDRRPAAAARAPRRADPRPRRRTTPTSSPRPALLEARGIELLRVERGGEVTYHGPGQLVAYPIVRLADRGLLLRPFVRALEGALVGHCAAFGRHRRPPRGPPRLLGGPGRAAAAQDRRPRPPRRARRELPRHRAQRQRGPLGLRPHRPVRDARPRVHLDRVASWAAATSGRPPRASPGRRASSRRAFATRHRGAARRAACPRTPIPRWSARQPRAGAPRRRGARVSPASAAR